MTDDDNENDNGSYEIKVKIDLVQVEIKGDDPEWVSRGAERLVEEAFERYEEHIDQGPRYP